MIDPAGHEAARGRIAKARLGSWDNHEFSCGLDVSRPQLWSIETPTLYKLVTVIRAGGGVVDHYETPFGIRSIRFDPDHGFFLNGQRVELKGVANHQDHAGVGTAIPDALQDF